ncbi:hypothetical protein [Rudaeicoccus suwonensis]|uniref:Parallel beta helix pectate lyase-like protein n=1 Tax=Rudaeicoccus suwonensis TaxID=657409 RepID=A0A561EA14_9MICO|nr:hypothetical protein [Rudaeicoccus suwonensis]TWE12427.1 hypothetical protein BKA23_1235 [Rudaeicoccus suwonensis]
MTAATLDVRTAAPDVDLSGVACSTTALQQLLTDAPTGSVVHIPAGATINLSDGPVTPNGAVTLDARGATIVDNGTTPAFALGPDNSGSRFIGLHLQGDKGGRPYGNPMHRAFDCAGTPAVGADGDTDTAGWIRGLRFEDVSVDGFQSAGWWMQHCLDLAYRSCEVTNCGYAGFEHLSCWNVTIDDPHVERLYGKDANHYWQSYPIAFSRDQTEDDLARYPRSRWCDVRGGLIASTGWEGVETHGGDHITVLGTRVHGCYHGIAAVPCPDSTGADIMGPTDINVLFCTVESGVSDGSLGSGIKLIGAGISGRRTEAATGRIIGNTVIGYGSGRTNTGANGDPSTVAAGVQLYQTDHVLIDDFRIIEPSPFGIALWYDNTSARIGRGTISDPWHDTFANPAAVAIRSTGNSLALGEITLAKGTKSAAHKNAAGLYVSSNANAVRWTAKPDFRAAKTSTLGGAGMSATDFDIPDLVDLPKLSDNPTVADISAWATSAGLAR